MSTLIPLHSPNADLLFSDEQDRLNRERWQEIENDTALKWTQDIDENILENRICRAAMKACQSHCSFSHLLI